MMKPENAAAARGGADEGGADAGAPADRDTGDEDGTRVAAAPPATSARPARRP